MVRLARAEIQKQREEILELVGQHPEGASRAAIGKAYDARHKTGISQRTLIRRLEQLIAERKVVQEGESSTTLYKLREPATAAADTKAYVPLSAQGTKVRAFVDKPIIERKSVGYNRDWLFDYQPGKTWYLTKKIRTQLHEAGRTPDEQRPAGTFARDILNRLLIDLAWASSRLEGNTYTRLDTKNLLEFGQRASGKDMQEAQMILNHKTAIELLVSDAEGSDFTRSIVFALHAALAENLLGDPADEGQLRTRPVNITGTTFTPIAIPQVVRECFDHIVDTFIAIPDPFEQAFFAMVHIPYLQPFIDVNKRTSRLVANWPLVHANLCPLSFVDVPEQAYIHGTLAIYEQRRVELLRDVFVWAYERSCDQYHVARQSVTQPDPVRLRYRSELGDAVRATVLAGEPPRTDKLRTWAIAHGIPESIADTFAERALATLVNLHAASARRYNLRPREFESWRELFGGKASRSGPGFLNS